MKPSGPRQTVRFGPFETSLHDRELRRQGIRVTLQAQPFALLECLLARPGELVTRDELRRQLWPEGTFVDFDKSLNTAVMKLREALGDNPQAPLFIETVAKTGYRFIASVDRRGDPDLPADIVSPAPPEAVPRPRALRSRWAAWGAVAALVLLSAAIVALRAPPGDGPHVPAGRIRFDVRPPADAWLTGEHALSPDGRALAMVVVGSLGERRLCLRAIDSVDLQPLAGTEGAAHPFWAPDSASIGFFAGFKLKRIDLAGERVVRVVADALDPRGGAWGAGDVIVFAPDITGPLHRVAAAGGGQTVALRGLGVAPSHRWPSFLPDGKRFLFLALREKREESDVRLGDLSGRESTSLVLAASGAVYAAPGHLLYVKGRTLLVQGFDPVAGRTLGEPAPLSDGVPAAGESGATGYGPFSAAPGLLTFARMDDRIVQFAWLDRDGRELGVVGPPGTYYHPELSQDGAQLTLVQSDAVTRTSDLWRIDLSRGVMSRLTLDSFPDSLAVWSPDGRRVAFASLRQSRWSVIVRSTGSGAEQSLFSFDVGGAVSDWSSDGRTLVGTLARGSQSDMWRFDLGRDSQPVVFGASPSNEAQPRFSPDGRWVVFSSDRTGRFEVYLSAVGGADPPVQVSSNGGEQPSWRGDGRELFFLSPSRAVMAASVDLAGGARLGVPRSLFESPEPQKGFARAWGEEFLPARDGKRFLVPRVVVPQGSRSITVDVAPLYSSPPSP